MTTRDEPAFEEFVAATAQSLRRTAFLLCGDWQRAEDAAQDALVKVYLAWNRLERSEGLRAYAHRAVTTAVIDQSRRPWRREVFTAHLPTQVTADPSAAVDRRAAVVAALQGLAPRRRSCVVLRYFADLPVSEVASILRISPGTVKSQTARALDQVRESLVASGLDCQLEELS